MDEALAKVYAYVSSVFAQPLRLEAWDWDSLARPSTFRWQLGTTPLSNWQVIAASWAVYFLSILLLRIFMRNREPMKLKWVTAFHNLFLSAWSLVMMVYAVIDVVDRAQTLGVDEIFCTSTKATLQGRLFYITYFYYISKFYELLDTIILVLKKKDIIFLHWYHHAIVILMVWSWLESGILYSSLGMIANTFIHVWMYYYYFASSIGMDVWFKKYITSGQIVQFTVSFILSIPYLYFHFTNSCKYGFESFLFSMFCNGSFLILFIQFYKRTYVSKKKPISDGKDKKTK